MSTKSFRATPEIEQKLNELFAFYGIKGEFESDKLREFINEIYDKLVRYKDSQPSGEKESEQKPDMAAIECKYRISLEKSESGYACVTRPPRVVKLDSLEICKVCRLFFQLDIKAPRTETVGEKPAEPLPLVTLSDGRQVEDLRSPDYKLRKMCPPEIEKLLYFEQAPEKEAVRIRTKAWLPERDFRTVSQWILSVNGEYISNGKDSHFLVPYKAVNAQPSKT